MQKGDICYIAQASAPSLKEHAKYLRRGLPLVCPCVYKRTEKMIITDVLGKFCLVSPVDDKSKLTIVATDDLILA